MLIGKSASFVCRQSALALFVALALVPYPVTAQSPSQSPTGAELPQNPVDGHAAHRESSDSPQWRFMQDGVVFLTFSRQARPRGDTEFVSQNWWMGMGRRAVGTGTLTLTGMFSLEPVTVGSDGYSEIFQTGEAFQGRAIIDRQHPHDLVMQLARVYRLPIAGRTGFTIAGGPAGEATLGPVAFMHRASSAENPIAPLGHHTFDSTHIAKGVVAVAVDHGPWVIESSLFHGREPDEDRWNISDVGALDSWATRLWFRAGTEWEFQASHGYLHEPEELEPGSLRRTTVSASWMTRPTPGFSAITVGYGLNDKDHADAVFDAFFAEGTHRSGRYVLYSRFEATDVETELLLGAAEHEGGEESPLRDTVVAFTVGAVRDLPPLGGFEFGLGSNITFHNVPERLVVNYGARPVSFIVFLRVRAPVSAMGRMWNMTMTRPMSGLGRQRIGS